MTLADGFSLEIAAVANAYASGAAVPTEVIDLVYAKIAAWADPAAWISMVPHAQARAAAAALPLDGKGLPAREGLPLYGIPFSVKDNIDVAGMPTTAACADFAYTPAASAALVDRLVAAGAILIGKNNLDQFATGLSGTRSPYGTPRNPVTPTMVPGGSSSGSAASVSAGLVSFSIGTDTAGSGRVPAALQSIVGIKPSRGLVSTRGLVPACRSLDCPSVFALTVADAAHVLDVIAGFDEDDPWSRDLKLEGMRGHSVRLGDVTLGVPQRDQLGWTDDVGLSDAWDAFLSRLVSAGAQLVTVDMTPFLAAGRLLYGGPWIAERWAGLEHFVESTPESVHPVTKAVLSPGHDVTGADAFKGLTRLMELRRESSHALVGVDALVTPTTTAAFTLQQMAAEPIVRNAALGRFSTFVNLLDLAAVAVPAGATDSGVPFGVTLHSAAGSDTRLSRLAAAVEGASERVLGATGWLPTAPSPTSGMDDRLPPTWLAVAVAGAHLTGLPLHAELLATGAELLAKTTTAPMYRLYELAGTTPRKPGLARVSEGGESIEIEVYAMPLASVGAFLASIPAPLGLGTVQLVDGSSVKGFVCEGIALDGARDVTEFGGWRAALRAVSS